MISKNCDCCKVLCGNVDKCYQKILITLKGGWVLNHYGGSDTYLGRLVLETYSHIEDWESLNQYTHLKYLGGNLQTICKCLRRYWEKHTEYLDKIEQFNIAYLNESPFKNGYTTGKELTDRLHIHFHILPRTRRMRESLCDPEHILGWHLIDCISCFPEEYQLQNRNYLRAKRLMEYLSDCLSSIKVEETTKCK